MLTSFLSSKKFDIRSGFLIFLIAMPLSAGIAVASGAPATAGLLAAIVGGIVGSFFSGCRFAIYGPAAGLIVTVVAAIQELGAGDPVHGYRTMLACVVIAGLFQVILGRCRLATLGLKFPKAVVHGMLAAIGLIIIAKQLYLLMGITGVAGGPIQLYLQLPMSIAKLNPAVTVVGCVSLALLIGWSFTPSKWQAVVPAPLLAALLGGVVAALIGGVGSQYLSVPDSLWAAVAFPSFASIGTFLFWKHTVIITLIASAESVLSTCAVDRLTDEEPPSDLNKDLTGNGVANVVCGCVGGLPIITEILRSSANVANGARSKWSNFFHGFFLLLFLALMPMVLRFEPLAALAAILIVAGWRLAAPSRFVDVFRQGWDQGLVFLITIAVILSMDLLTGVLVGSVCAWLISKVVNIREQALLRK